MKSKSLCTILGCFIATFFFTTQASAQCCRFPDSLKIKSVFDSSFCLQWNAHISGVDSSGCDTARSFEVQYKPLGDTIHGWNDSIKRYNGKTTVTFCDTASPCKKYQWRVRNICVHNGDTTYSAWINGPRIVMNCDTGHLLSNHSITQLQAHHVSITPNPATSSIVISGSYVGTVQIDIVNMNGKKVYTNTIQSVQGKLSLPITISAFDKGIYFVTVSDTKSSVKVNFIKQ